MNSRKKFKSIFDVLGIRLDEKEPYKPHIQDLELALIELIYLAEHDLRAFSLLISWCKIHSDSIIYEKLEKHYKAQSKFRNQTVVYDIFMVFCSHYGKRRIKNRISKRKKKTIFPENKATVSMLKRSPTLEILEEYNILVPEKTLRIRESDVLEVKELIKKNKQYKNRYQYGPGWRSDIVFHIEQGASSPFEISKNLGCSYEPANRVWREYQMICA